MLMRSKPSVTVVSSAVTRNCCCWSSVCSAMALSLPPLQQKRMGSNSDITCRSVPAGEAIVEAEAVVAAKSGKADSLLVLLVEEIGHAAIEGNAPREEAAGRDVETRVAGIPVKAQPVKVAIRPRSSNVSINVEVEAAVVGVEPNVAGVHGASQEVIAGLLKPRAS